MASLPLYKADSVLDELRNLMKQMKRFSIGTLVRGIGASLRKTNRNKADRERAAYLREAIETVVDGTDTRIRLVRGYQKKLAKCVGSSLEYVDALVEKIPAPVDINKQMFATDPRVHAFFVSVKHMQTSFSRSSELREFFEDPGHRGTTHSVALLCMQRSEKKGFGLDLVGNMVRRDVPQTTVSFSDHQVFSPSATEADAREGIKQCIFNGLVTNALERIASLSAEKQRLQSYKRDLSLQLRHLQTSRQELVPSYLSDREQARKIEDIKRKLAEIESNSKQNKVALVTPEDYLAQVKRTLKHPQRYISLRNVSIKLNRMGVKIREGSGQAGAKIDLAEIKIGNTPKRVVLLARFPRDELLPKEDFVQQADRYLAK